MTRKMKLSVVILSAGMGVRMRSNTPKVLHKVGAMPILEHQLKAVTELGSTDIRVVVNEQMLKDKTFKALLEKYKFTPYLQKERKGTGHAFQAVMDKKFKHPVLLMYGDIPLIQTSTLEAMYKRYTELDADLLCLGFKAKDPKGYGRLLTYEDDIVGIVEELDATDEQRKIDICNSGIYIFDNKEILDLVNKLSSNNKANEYYLTEIIALANKAKLRCVVHLTNETEVMGINDKAQLATAEMYFQQRLRKKFLNEGVTMIDPQTVYFSADTKIGKDVTIHPNVIFGEGVELEDEVEIFPFSHISGAKICEGASIGPFARVRPKSKIGKNSKVGNFVEVKAAEFGEEVKASHLSYIGDAKVGDNTNIGAGTIFCNYDGYSKHFSKIGKDVSIGANTSVVSPVQVGDRAIIGAGSVITENVEDNALSISRARQVNFQQKAELIRKKKGS